MRFHCGRSERLANGAQIERCAACIEGGQIDPVGDVHVATGAEALAHRLVRVEIGVVERVAVDLRRRDLGAIQPWLRQPRTPLIDQHDGAVAAQFEGASETGECLRSGLSGPAAEKHHRIGTLARREVVEHGDMYADPRCVFGKAAIGIEIAVSHRQMRHQANRCFAQGGGKRAVDAFDLDRRHWRQGVFVEGEPAGATEEQGNPDRGEAQNLQSVLVSVLVPVRRHSRPLLLFAGTRPCDHAGVEIS